MTENYMNKYAGKLNGDIRVLYAAFEAAPFAKSGGLGEVAGSLPQALAGVGVDARLIMPKLGAIPAEYTAKMQHIVDFTLPLGWRRQYCGLEKLELDGRVAYFIDNEYYYKRDALYGYGDDAERTAFFAKAVVAVIPFLARMDGFSAEILHCNDWHTALSPVLLREESAQEWGKERAKKGYNRGIKSVMSVHNLQFQGWCDPIVLDDILGLPPDSPAREKLQFKGAVNYLHGALSVADRLLTVSPTYADEICTPEYGEGLDALFVARRAVLGGILNGIDTTVYDPACDPHLVANFAAGDMAGKAACKRAVQRELGLPPEDVPLLVLISRLTEQKGLDLLLQIMDELLGLPVQVAWLGVGDSRYEDAARYYDGEYPNFAARLLFDDGLAHRMYAGGDMLLMPSRFEPCGLAQMIAMRYGTLPIVRECGGLRDSVVPYNRYTGEGNGFSFANYRAGELLDTVRRALVAYRDEAAWRRLVDSALAADFSWGRSAGEYATIYRELVRI